MEEREKKVRKCQNSWHSVTLLRACWTAGCRDSRSLPFFLWVAREATPLSTTAATTITGFCYLTDSVRKRGEKAFNPF